MKFRPDDTMSERQLVLALARTGRNVALGRLAAWRKDGLLPPLASTGVGAGRAYYWREPDILRQAEIVHDGLARHGRAEVVTVALWLRGFTVALPKLKRAWQSCLKTRKTPAIGRPPTAQSWTAAADLSTLLLQVTLGTAAAVHLDDASRPALLLLAAAANRLDIAVSDRGAQVRQFWQLAQMVASVLAASDLVGEAGEADMLKARGLLRTALRFVEDSTGEDSARVADVLGQTLFLFILTLLRSGQEAMLETAFARIAAAGAPPRAHQPQPLYAQA